MSTVEVRDAAHRVGAVVDLSHSPHVRLRPVPVNAVTLQDTFWSPRITLNRERTIPGQYQLCEDTGRLDNFRRASGKKQIDFQGIYFNDSDIYKWLEAAAFSLATHPDPKLDADVDAVIAEVAAAQEPDGYLNTYFMFERAAQRWTNLKDMHEMYCAGHLIQAAVAHHRATGKRSLLDVAIRLADCIDTLFGPEPGKRIGACGHEEAEMALVELYRDTGEERYLKLAKFMIDARGHLFGKSAYHQDHVPFVEQTEMIGHAVRHMYLTCGATDVAAEQDLPSYRHALETLWRNFTGKKMYVTGAAGARHEGESFGANYELPNDRAYAETCAAIGSVMWNWRLLNLTGEARFADLMEVTLYNGVLSGLSLDGTHYFYENPLADRGKHRRQEWFGCACCPPNVARLLASLPGYFYSVSPEGVWCHLYANGAASLPLANGETLSLAQKTRYPWEGEVEILIESAPSIPFALNLRIPAFAIGATVTVNGEAPFAAGPGTYATVEREWEAGDRVLLSLPMPIERLQSHPHVASNRDRIALKRGPLVYCIEQADHADADVWDIALPAAAEITTEHLPHLLGGVTVLRSEGMATAPDPERPLYSPYDTNAAQPSRPVTVTAIPYYAWANREAGPMQVWIPVEPQK